MIKIDELASSGFAARTLLSPSLRAAGLLLLAFLLRIPIEMIGSSVGERQGYRDEAIREVTATWGGSQILRGPFLAIPFVEREQTKTGVHEVHRVRYSLPENLDVDGTLEAEIRRRGIFDVPLYSGEIGLSGSMRLPEAKDFPPRAEVEWQRARWILSISDPKALRNDAVLQWGSTSLPMQAGPGFDLFAGGIHAELGLGEAESGALLPFALKLQLAGSGGFSLVPAADETSVRLRSNASHPSFMGAFSPISRRVGAAGFEATWRVPRLARSFPSAWCDDEVRTGDVESTAFGVTLFPPVDAYRSTERALKYDLLFIGLTFLAFFAFEQSMGRRVSLVQYALVGLALCLFYLLLLSLAEHLAFALAYLLAAAAVTAMITAYSRAVLDSGARMAAIGGLVGALYAYLYVLLQLQDFALLAGSLGLFAVLAVAMYRTRRVNAATFSPEHAAA